MSMDQHRIPFTGCVDWPRVMDIIARSVYDKWISMECSMRREPYETDADFLAHAFEAGSKLARMLDERRGASGNPTPIPDGSQSAQEKRRIP